MRRTLLAALPLTAPALAAESYEEIIHDARRLEGEIRPGEQADVALERAYQRLGEAAQLAPGRWEAFALRGTNRCTAAVVCREILLHLLGDARARGEPPDTVQAMEARGYEFIGICIANARQNFSVMHANMQRTNEVDPNRLQFVIAALRFAEAEYLTAPDGTPGAIDEFKELMRRGWMPDYCSEFVARSYVQLGVTAVSQDRMEEAQQLWDEALKWSRTAATRRVILSNKAATFDLHEELGRAEALVRQQIEMEPDQPIHWKNLGLMLGHQNKLRAALRAYERTRALCESVEGPVPLGAFHGSAWLKAAMIHGKLLEEDGDLPLAWRLFLEYRAMLGDDYNFCINFGEFAFHMGQFDLAWTYLGRARDLQPFCLMPHQLLLMTALRLQGPPDEMKIRIEKAREAHREAQRRFLPSDESPALKRLCGGLRDRISVGLAGSISELLDPDPLAAHGPERPPEWITAAAATRQPFRADAPDPVEQGSERNSGPTSVEPVEGLGLRSLYWGLALGLPALATAAWLLSRRGRPGK